MKTKLPKDGSKWTAGDHREFTVLHTVELNGNMWIHYRDNEREYSCYVESFLQRFWPLP